MQLQCQMAVMMIVTHGAPMAVDLVDPRRPMWSLGGGFGRVLKLGGCSLVGADALGLFLAMAMSFDGL